MKDAQGLLPGSHLVSPRNYGAYTHHGIYIGNSQVIHYSGFAKDWKAGKIEQATLDYFSQDAGYSPRTYKHPKFPGEHAIGRAKARLENQDKIKQKETYNLLVNNCEHFCHWCINGDHSSQQVDKLLNLASIKTTKTVLNAIKGRVALSPPVAAVASVVEITASFAKYLKGDIDAERLTQEISHSAISNAGIFYYGALGQASIPIPVVGALVGATVGYLLGNMICQSGLVALGEADVVRAARKRREMIESLCAESIVQQQQYRQQLEKLLEQHFEERHQCFSQAFATFDQSLINWDETSVITGLESINEAFGKSLPFKSFDEFSNFMQDKEQAFVF